MRFLRSSIVTLALLASCGGAAPQKSNSTTTKNEKKTNEPKFSTAYIVNSYAHNPHSYTQGLLIRNGKVYESTGEYGHSKLLVTDLKSGKIEKEIALSNKFFGEGLALLNDKLYQLTWLEGKCFVYDANTLQKVATLDYQGEGWGIVAYGDKLIMSNGTAELKVLDPNNFGVLKTIEVHDHRGRVSMLNELEMVDSLLYANIYTSPLVAVINPQSGSVVEYIDCSTLYKGLKSTTDIDVLNGIAYDSVARKLYLTGKRWDSLFEVDVR